jgi:aerobic-type carbon monoxide dehydrogenase small subunit (CoxS/CutS family)
MSTATTVTGRINGRERTLRVENAELLLDLLRDLGLKGAKPSCEMEVCGTCTVQLDGLPVSACTTLAVELDGRSVETVEHLGATAQQLHPVQTAFLERSALQCGFCTPGMVMACKALLDKKKDPSLVDIKKGLSGNICRCGTYTRIFTAVQAASKLV